MRFGVGEIILITILVLLLLGNLSKILEEIVKTFHRMKKLKDDNVNNASPEEKKLENKQQKKD